MKVSIIIPCYNHYKFLPDALESCYAQSYKNIEIIVVDDCSLIGMEGSGITGAKFIYHTHETNKGLAATRNTGIRYATGDLILPLDADDKIHPTYVEKAVAKYKEHERDIIACHLETFGEYVRISRIPMNALSWKDFRIANRVNCCSLYSKKMWEQLGGYDEKMRYGYEDWELWSRAAKAGYKFHVIPEILFYYRKHPGPSMLDGAKEKRNQIIAYMRNKGSI